eukprot:TRINITY_DN62435_c0_g1_i1.p1 TRINITY_DN62435_c0_g1~~TRINITY_DN62435_c0_g1_i1.p1  ORF type:complete len:347 (+),score=59.06 TRINITY_DN62435_c0_g1_i1:49-1041(+)
MDRPTTLSDAASDSKGVFFMISSEVLLVIVNAIIKFVKAWPVERIMAVRYTSDFLLCVILCVACRLPPPPSWVAAKLLFRGVAYIAFIVCLWGGLRSCLPLGDVVVLVVAISPLFLVLLTRLLLGEKIPPMWPLQLALCVTGALLVNKPLAPASGCTATAALLPLAAAFFGALMNFMSRNVKDVPPPVVMAFNDVVAVVFACGAIAFNHSSDDLETAFLPDGFDKGFAFIALSAVIGWAGLMCNVKGYQSVSVAAVASIAGYISVPLGYMVQVFAFDEIPDIFSIIGASLILCTNVTVAVSKYRAAKAEAKGQDNECYKPLPTNAKQEDA